MIFTRSESAGHEQIVHCRDRRSGLRAIVAIHSTALGPSLGGIRMRDYSSEEEALVDVLRLSEAMTWKASVAGLDFGGGKAVVLGTPPPERRADVFRSLGRFVDSLSGRYVPTEDMGTYTPDVERLRETSRWGVGISAEQGGGGDPSSMTAWGVFCGLRAAIDAAKLAPGFAGKTVAVQGVGKVGRALVRYLLEAGAEVHVSDVVADRLEEAKRLGARVVPNETIHRERCDVFAPCAGGAVLSERTIPELACKIVGGGANNQLAVETDDERLLERGIVYAPDFVINAGGLINVADELGEGGYRRERALARTEAIEPTLRRVFAESTSTSAPPGRVALALARRRVEGAVA
ncbi:MAG: Glu/Leu/Phe/Val family dehydrogenase [Candidatus Binatia bacterium]